MTTGAWLMFGITCGVITVVTLRFFLMALRKPPKGDG